LSLESHYQERSKKNDSRGTPPEFIKKLEKLLGLRFDDYDPCSLSTDLDGMRGVDGLGPAPESVRCYFANPPYSRGETEKWCRKFRNDQLNGVTVVALLKNAWTSGWFKRQVFPHAQVIPVLGRIKFTSPPGPCRSCGTGKGKARIPAPLCRRVDGHGAPFENVVAVYRPGILPVLPTVIYP
jgi:hypothetical protein